MERLVIFNDIVGMLRKQPEMYLGHDKVSAPHLASLLVGDALVLGEREVKARRPHEDWMVVSAKSDWTARGPGSGLPRAQLFRQLINFPEAGLNEARHEVYVIAYATNVFVATRDRLEVMQGAVPPQELLQELEQDAFHLGFRL